MDSYYKFSKELEPELLKFINASNQQKGRKTQINLETYESLNKIFPLDLNLIKKAKQSSCEDPAIINLTDSDLDEEVKEEDGTNLVPLPTVAFNVVGDSNETSARDIAFVIHENLENVGELTEFDHSRLRSCENSDLEQVFQILSEQLNTEEVLILSKSLCKIPSDSLVCHFCKYIILPKVKEEYNLKTLNALEEISLKYPLLLKEAVLSEFANVLNKCDIGFMLKYLKQLNSGFQAHLLKDYLYMETELRHEYLNLINELLNSQVEYEALTKLVELLSNAAKEHENDAVFGKLTLHVIEILGSNSSFLEKPLKHIIGIHKSIWKAKLKKTFTNCFEDTMSFSQSFY